MNQKTQDIYCFSIGHGLLGPFMPDRQYGESYDAVILFRVKHGTGPTKDIK